MLTKKSTKNTTSKQKEKGPRSQPPGPSSTPMLAYSWGKTLHILQVFESKTSRRVRNKNNNKLEEVVTAKIIFENRANLLVDSDILAVQFLNLQVCLFFLLAACLAKYQFSIPSSKFSFSPRRLWKSTGLRTSYLSNLPPLTPSHWSRLCLFSKTAQALRTLILSSKCHIAYESIRARSSP